MLADEHFYHVGDRAVFRLRSCSQRLLQARIDSDGKRRSFGVSHYTLPECLQMYCNILYCALQYNRKSPRYTYGGKLILFLKGNLNYYLTMAKQTFTYPQVDKAVLLIRKLLVVCAGFAAATYNVLLDIFASREDLDDTERRLHDSDLSGELNHRTGRVDAGTDPYGWYDD